MTRIAIPALVVFFSLSAHAQSLSESASRLNEAQKQFRTCQNGKLQLEFGPVLARLEGARKSLEKGRRETEAARRTLEAGRKRIEAAHQLRHLTAEERVAKEEQYAQSLAANYDAPMQALHPLVASYVEGIDRYASVIQQYADFCAKGGITTASAREFVSTVKPTVEQLDGSAKDLVASASKAAAGDMAAR